MSAPARRRLAVGGIAVFEDAERCMRALSARSAFVEPVGAALEAAAVELPAERPATEAEALQLLGACGVPVARTEVCPDAAAAAAAAATIGGAVVVKASARDLPHKAAAGASPSASAVRTRPGRRTSASSPRPPPPARTRTARSSRRWRRRASS